MGKESQENRGHFFSEDIMNHVLGGSFETYLGLVEGFIHENTDKIVGENISTRLNVLGTFKGFALVCDLEENIYRVKFDMTGEGFEYKSSEKAEDIKKFTCDQIESKMESNLINALNDAIAKNSEECDNVFKEHFSRMIAFKKNRVAEGFIKVN